VRLAPSKIADVASQVPEDVKTVSSWVTLRHTDAETVNTATDPSLDRAAMT
jgi:hypothetical protein